MTRPEAAIAILAWIIIAAQTGLNISRDGAPLDVIWSQLRFFTFLTNITVAIVMTRAALTGQRPGASLSTAITVWITVVMLVYHALLNQGFTPDMIDFYTDHGLHTVVPVVTIGWWVMRAHKGSLGARDAALWCLFPIAYLLYALARGLIGGTYPYFFIDPTRDGWATVGAWVAAMTVLFFLVGCLYAYSARLLTRKR